MNLTRSRDVRDFAGVFSVVLFALVAVAGFAQLAAPENVLIEGYTFARPAAWKWEPTGKDAVTLCRFALPPKNGEVETDVRIYSFTGTTEHLARRVLANFEAGAKLVESSATVSGTNLTYLTISGTTVARKDMPRPNYRLVAIVLPSREQDDSFFLRLFGPRAEVDAATPDFKKMVEEAVASGD